MRWYLSVWDADHRAWVAVGWVHDGANNRTLYAVMRGLLRDYAGEQSELSLGSQVDCQHPESGRRERYVLDGDGTLIRIQRPAPT